jgi:hypothetical protein
MGTPALRHRKALKERLALLNPVKRGLAATPEQYPYSSARAGMVLDAVPQRLKPSELWLGKRSGEPLRHPKACLREFGRSRYKGGSYSFSGAPYLAGPYVAQEALVSILPRSSSSV